MRTAVLIACPFMMIFAAVSCGDSSSSDSSGTSGSANAAGSTPVGGESSQAGGGSTSTAGKTGGGGGTDSVAGAGAVVGEGGAATGTGGEATTTEGGAGGAAGGAGSSQCADVFGNYKILSLVGMCGTLNKGAPQSIQGTDVACFAHFVSTAVKGAAGINGGAMLEVNGGFSNAKLILDDAAREPCSGSWNALAETMTVKCGGAGDLCTVLLQRK